MPKATERYVQWINAHLGFNPRSQANSNALSDFIVGATVVINPSPLYENPDAFAHGLERPRFKMEKVVKDTVKVFTGIPLRESPNDPSDQPEALGVIVVDYDGVNLASLVTNEL